MVSRPRQPRDHSRHAGEELARSPSFPPKIKKKNSLYYLVDNPAFLERPIFNGSRDHGRNTSCDRAITARNTSCAVSCAVVARPLKKWVVPLRFVAFYVFPCALCVRLSRRFDHTRRRNTFLLGFTVRSWDLCLNSPTKGRMKPEIHSKMETEFPKHSQQMSFQGHGTEEN